MNNLFTYLFQSAVALAVLYSVYWIFLRRDTFFRINRAYLLCALLLSAILPLFPFSMPGTSAGSSLVVFLDPVVITPERIEQARSGHFTLIEIAGIVYLAGVGFFLARLAAQIILIVRIIRRNRILHHDGMNVVYTDRGFSPFSFFNIVFIGKEYIDDEKTGPVLIHEKVHIRQNHTIDLMAVELMAVIQWFNPFIWLLGRSMKSIHEFLADEGVLQSGIPKSKYQELIFNESAGLQINSITNHFNVSLIKNRIIMMTKNRSGAWAAGKLLFMIPAILILVFFFSAGKTSSLFAQETKKEQPKDTKSSTGTPSAKPTSKPVDQKKNGPEEDIFVMVEDMPTFPGGDEARAKFMMENIKYPENAAKKGIQGTVFVQFVVEKDGKISNVKILRGFDKECDAEAVRVVKLMPDWNPGKQRGQAVRVQFNLPIKFVLGDKDKKEDKKQ